MPLLSAKINRRRLALAIGAGSAFDVTGLHVLNENLFDQPALDPSSAVAADMARVMRTFGYSVRCGQIAFDSGRTIEDLEPGCADPDDDVAPDPRRVIAAFRDSD